MQVKFKRVAAATILSGGIAALAFGGSSVATSWTQSSSGSVHADAATFSNTIQTGNLSLDNALPGDVSAPATVGFANNGSTPENVSLTVTPPGNALGALATYVHVLINGQDVGTISQAPAQLLGKVPANQNLGSYSVTLKLADNAPDTVQGAHFDATYTVTATATH